MKVTINRIKGNNFAAIVKKMLLMDSQIYLTIESNTVASNVYLPTKDVVKTTTIPLNEVFELDEAIDKPIKLGFFNGAKVISALGYFDLAALRGELSLYEIEGEYYAESLTLEDNSLKITLNCQDPDLGFVSMTEDQISIAFSDRAKKYEFDMVEADLAKILSLNGMDKSELFQIYGDDSGIHIKGDNYDYIVDDNVKGSFEPVSLHKKFLARLDKENYTVQVCTGEQNKIVLRSKSTQTNIALNLALGVQ